MEGHISVHNAGIRMFFLSYISMFRQHLNVMHSYCFE